MSFLCLYNWSLLNQPVLKNNSKMSKHVINSQMSKHVISPFLWSSPSGSSWWRQPAPGRHWWTRQPRQAACATLWHKYGCCGGTNSLIIYIKSIMSMILTLWCERWHLFYNHNMACKMICDCQPGQTWNSPRRKLQCVEIPTLGRESVGQAEDVKDIRPYRHNGHLGFPENKYSVYLTQSAKIEYTNKLGLPTSK